MKHTFGVFDTHDAAVAAITQLQSEGYPTKKLSIIGEARSVDNHLVVTGQTTEEVEMSVGLAAGSVLGVLTGVGIFAIPGFGFLFGAGALVGAFAGLDIGLIGGGLVAILTKMGMDAGDARKYEDHLKQGKFVVVAEGNDEEIAKANKILAVNGTIEK